MPDDSPVAVPRKFTAVTSHVITFSSKDKLVVSVLLVSPGISTPSAFHWKNRSGDGDDSITPGLQVRIEGILNDPPIEGWTMNVGANRVISIARFGPRILGYAFEPSKMEGFM